MIDKVKVSYFKSFEDETFDLSDHIILAGPNNSGKTTLLQAIVVWDLALRRWKERRGPESGSKAQQRTGVPLTRKDFTALPLREMNLLWTDTLTALRKDDLQEDQKPGHPRVLSITVEGNEAGRKWELTFEFRYQNSELVYVKPASDQIDELPEAVGNIRVVHVPPFSGIGAEETRYDTEYQNLLIGQGKPGDILRNLLLEVYQKDRAQWRLLCDDVEEVFQFALQPPQYEGRPFILCEYLPGVPSGRGKGGLKPLDISSAGSGFHQVLLLLGFLYVRPATVLLLDEPDAHLHVVLQKQIYSRLMRLLAKRKCQLIIATHSEVLIDGTSPEHVLSFYGKPHRLLSGPEKDPVREGLKRLVAMDLLLAEGSAGVLYVESEEDFNLLRAWAKVLRHALYDRWFMAEPFWHNNQGRSPKEARAHFFALRAVRPAIRGYLLLDGDNRGLPDHEASPEGLVIGRWTRYESESYLVHPEALRRFLEQRAEPLFRPLAQDFLKNLLPPAIFKDPVGDHDYLNRTPASKTLLPGYFKAAEESIAKDEYFLIAEQMTADEICPEVGEKLDDIAQALGV